jgi:single-strand DNA-binding protein
MNSVSIVGRITRDLELRKTQAGDSVLNFTLAVDDPFSKDGEADFVPVVVWRKTADIVSQYCHKGTRLGVEGKIKTKLIEKEGKKSVWFEVLGTNVTFLESKPKEEQKQNVKPAEDIPEDDLPF